MMQKYQKRQKYFTTSDYKKFTKNTLDTKIKTKKLVNEADLNEEDKNISNKRRNKIISSKRRIKSSAR